MPCSTRLPERKHVRVGGSKNQIWEKRALVGASISQLTLLHRRLEEDCSSCSGEVFGHLKELLRCEVRLRHPKTAIRTLMLLLSQLLPSSTNVPTATGSIISGSDWATNPHIPALGHKAVFFSLQHCNPPNLIFFPPASKAPER